MRLSKQAAEQLSRTPKVVEVALTAQRDEAHSLIRAERKAQFAAAKDADTNLMLACGHYDAASTVHTADKKALLKIAERVNRLETEAKQLDTQIKKLQLEWRAKRKAYGEAKTERNDFAVRLTALARTRNEVQEAWDACEEAWGKISKTFVKKHRNRAARKSAREILKSV